LLDQWVNGVLVRGIRVDLYEVDPITDAVTGAQRSVEVCKPAYELLVERAELVADKEGRVWGAIA
jgi:hypothetical protein